MRTSIEDRGGFSLYVRVLFFATNHGEVSGHDLPTIEYMVPKDALQSYDKIWTSVSPLITLSEALMVSNSPTPLVGLRIGGAAFACLFFLLT
jgi:hypothetical protein